MDIGLEIVSHSKKDGGQVKKKTMYVVFGNKKERDFVYEKMMGLVSKDCVTTERSLEDYTQQWCGGKLTNFDYLMLLNSYAQRSFQDLT